ncbi:MAG: hypothetical protein AAF725_05965 [Acidobacteriota bacterium]
MKKAVGFLFLAAATGTLLAALLGRPADPAAPPPEEKAAEAAEARFERVVASMWWHRDRFSELLDLSARQKSRMDSRCLESLRRRLRLRLEARAEAEVYREALAAGRFEEAGEAVEKLAVLASDLHVIEERMTLEVIALLGEAQREKLREAAPALLTMPWLKTLGPARPGAGRDGASESGRSRPAS